MPGTHSSDWDAGRQEMETGNARRASSTRGDGTESAPHVVHIALRGPDVAAAKRELGRL